ncbi:MAG: hypothetical protein SFW66_03105 [Gammaproteobacteria bacterium]|nr:hypothetical protein [Gammaproteobacteria bacterium]
MSYYITKQFQRGGEVTDGTFYSVDEAKKSIQDKLRQDQQLKMQVVYRLYDDLDQLQATFDSSSIEQPVSGSSSSESSSSAGKGSGFNPTPFNTAPRPPGIPHSWISDEDKKKGEEKK